MEEDQDRCPYCGEPRSGPAGVFRTSTVLIAAGRANMVYRSVAEVPARLRTRLAKSTSGANSATILIADRRGRREIAKALRGSGEPSRAPAWLTRQAKRAISAIIVLLAVALVLIAFLHR
jgi:hypothetical protein